MSSARLPYLTAKLQGFGTTIFAEMSALAMATGSVNLGQGFPDTDGPREVLDAAIAAINDGVNQYPPGPGMPVLREAIAAHQQRFYGSRYDPDSEVLVTAGATEALAGALMGLLDTGDEVVLFEPMYDSYQACIALAGAVAKPVTLRPPSYRFDPDELRAAITPKTKLLLINTPAQPDRPGARHRRAAADRRPRHRARPDRRSPTRSTSTSCSTAPSTSRWRRCRACASERWSISSGGKTFNTTGWKIGWICGPPPLDRRGTHGQAVPHLRQRCAVPTGDRGRPRPARLVLRRVRRRHAGQARPPPARPARRRVHGVSDRTARTSSRSTSARCNPTATAWRSAARCPARCGVVAIPNEVFYANRHEGRHLVRFAFCKRLDVLDEAAERLAKLATG